jgi:thioredoxin reductase
MYDVIIVGGGPAGLSAATILGRCRRRVLLCDDGRYRNAASHAIHGFLSRDGIDPAEFRRIAREQLMPYGIECRAIRVTRASRTGDGFEVTLEGGAVERARHLLLATGVVDHIPKTDGMDRFFGAGVYHCPYCDGWENRDQPLASWGSGRNGAGLAAALLQWSGDVALCTDGPSRLAPPERARLDRLGIAVYRQPVARLEGGERLERIVFRDGSSLERRAIFLSTGQEQRCSIAGDLGCAFTRKGAVQTGKLEGTSIPGLYVVGDASRDVQLAVVAAAEGAKAAIAINRSLSAK